MAMGIVRVTWSGQLGRRRPRSAAWKFQPTRAAGRLLSINTHNGPCGTCAGWITGSATARWLIVV